MVRGWRPAGGPAPGLRPGERSEVGASVTTPVGVRRRRRPPGPLVTVTHRHRTASRPAGPGIPNVTASSGPVHLRRPADGNENGRLPHGGQGRTRYCGIPGGRASVATVAAGGSCCPCPLMTCASLPGEADGRPGSGASDRRADRSTAGRRRWWSRGQRPRRSPNQAPGLATVRAVPTPDLPDRPTAVSAETRRVTLLGAGRLASATSRLETRGM